VLRGVGYLFDLEGGSVDLGIGLALFVGVVVVDVMVVRVEDILVEVVGLLVLFDGVGVFLGVYIYIGCGAGG
ncbi:hypothetical protein AAHH79_34390, partial [Burkholderia pseudomallei]